MSHPIRRENPAPSQWPSYTDASQLVGSSPTGRVTLYVDSSPGAPALQNAQDLINDADRVVAANDAIFGTTGGPASSSSPLAGDRWHWRRRPHGLRLNERSRDRSIAAFGQPMPVSALFEAELSESSMGGNPCGQSTGETLSRWQDRPDDGRVREIWERLGQFTRASARTPPRTHYRPSWRRSAHSQTARTAAARAAAVCLGLNFSVRAHSASPRTRSSRSTAVVEVHRRAHLAVGRKSNPKHRAFESL
jgi:hypothetical protein